MTRFEKLNPKDKILIEHVSYENNEPWEYTEKCEKGYITFEDLVRCINLHTITPSTLIGPGSNNYNRD